MRGIKHRRGGPLLDPLGQLGTSRFSSRCTSSGHIAGPPYPSQRIDPTAPAYRSKKPAGLPDLPLSSRPVPSFRESLRVSWPLGVCRRRSKRFQRRDDDPPVSSEPVHPTRLDRRLLVWPTGPLSVSIRRLRWPALPRRSSSGPLSCAGPTIP